MATQRYAIDVNRGPLALEGQTLTGKIVDATYNYDVDHETLADVTGEIVPDGGTRVTGTVTEIIRTGLTWKVILEDTTTVNISAGADRAGIAWALPGGSDAARSLVAYSPDPGVPTDEYTPTYDDGFYDAIIESFDDRLLPPLADGTSGQVPTLTAPGGPVEWADGGGGGGGAVTSVNGDTGDVVVASLGANTFTGPQTTDVDLATYPALTKLEEYRHEGDPVYRVVGAVVDLSGIGSGPFLPVLFPAVVEIGFDGEATGFLGALNYTYSSTDGSVGFTAARLSETDASDLELVPVRVGFSDTGDAGDAVPRSVLDAMSTGATPTAAPTELKIKSSTSGTTYTITVDDTGTPTLVVT